MLLLAGQGHLAQPFSVATTRACLSTNTRTAGVVRHAIVFQVWPRVLTTCVLGDPMKPSSDFRAIDLVHWRMRLQPLFPAAGELRDTLALGGWPEAEPWGSGLARHTATTSSWPAGDLRTAPAGSALRCKLNAGTESPAGGAGAARTESPNARGSVLISGLPFNVQGRHQAHEPDHPAPGPSEPST